MAMAMTYNMNRDEKTAAEPPSSFMPYYDALAQDISEQDLQSKLRSVVPKHTYSIEQQG